MTRRNHNHTLQTNPPHCDEEPQNIYINKTSVRQQKQINSVLYLFKTIAKVETGHKVMHYKTETNTEPPHTMRNTSNNR